MPASDRHCRITLERLKSLLHLMPPYRSPDGDDDGGYSVSSYRELDPELGTIGELEELAVELRRHGTSLLLDFVFNHTSDDHELARCALEGDETCQDYYLMFSSREEPDEYERHLRSIFPDKHQGSFSYQHQLQKWVWTTFHTYQWDLNYRNPEVFNAMAAEMLFLANLGVEVLRLDAVPFIWKQQGTNCENLPEAHRIIEAFNALTRIRLNNATVAGGDTAIIDPGNPDLRQETLVLSIELSGHPT